MDDLILAIECDPAVDIVCTPANVIDLFKFPALFESVPWLNRTVVLIFLAAFVVMGLLYFAFRRPSVVPTKFQATMESLVGFVRDGVAKDIIGPEGARYAPYLTALFFFILVGNLFEITPFVNFPITSRFALPAFLAILTWVIFVFVGFRKNGFRYLADIVWPRNVPLAIRWLVGIIELVSIFLVRPFSLAVRLFANLVAGHVMLSLLLVSAVVFLGAVGDIGLRSVIGIGWLALGLGIFVFEIVVSVLQAYIFTLLSAVYIQTSVHPEH